MDIKQISYFVEVVNHGSYSLAAKKLKISQPALSTSIKKLEEELEARLFFYSNKKLFLTDIGREFYNNSRKLLIDYNALIVGMQDLSSKDIGTIKLGVPVVIGSVYMADIMGRFKQEYPKINFQIIEEGGDIVADMVDKGELDCAAVIMPTSKVKFDVHNTIPNKYVIVVHKDNPLAKYDKVTFEMLKNEVFTTLTKTYTTNHIFISNCEKAGFTPEILVYTSQWDFMATLVANNQCICMLPRPLMEKYRNPVLKLLDIEGSQNEWTIGLITKKGQYLSKATRLFIDYVKKYNQQHQLEAKK
ncbi:MAG: LysR substrate-binding domain-containing protein [Bacilli bacterium]|nr:LysR substrate-binding domain-containing protein [Bacilli bacterium]